MIVAVINFKYQRDAMFERRKIFAHEKKLLQF